MSDSPSLEEIIAGAAKGGWDWFDQIDPRIRQMVDVRNAEKGQKAKRIAAAWAKFADSAGGREALDAMLDTTHRRATFFVQLGLPADQVAVWGAFREGQNSLAQEIVRQISAGRGDVQPKTRETT